MAQGGGAQGGAEVDGDHIYSLLNDQTHKYPEVLFPGRFTDRQAWMMDPGYVPRPPPSAININTLFHITHNAEAEAISAQGRYIFKPRAKFGKAYLKDGSSLGETYREKEIDSELYLKIPQNDDANPVFPGYLSWWGIDTRSDSDEFLGSGYGNNAFSISLSNILADYQTARAHKTRERACLKVGGTLRYRYEICYVVVVCMEGELDDMPIINKDNEVFNHQGLLDDNGVVVNRSKTPLYQAKTNTQTNKVYGYSWENLAFGFYFPNQEQELACTVANIQWTEVDHDPLKCTKKRPVERYSPWKCPNQIDI